MGWNDLIPDEWDVAEDKFDEYGWDELVLTENAWGAFVEHKERLPRDWDELYEFAGDELREEWIESYAKALIEAKRWENAPSFVMVFTLGGKK